MANEEKTMVITRKIKVTPVGDEDEVHRVREYVKEGCRNYNKAKNEYITALYAAKMLEMTSEDRKELHRMFARVPDSKKPTALTKDLKLPVGLPAASSMVRAIDADFSKACKEGLLHGKVSLPTYRTDGPMDVHVDYVRLRSTNPHMRKGLYHPYKDDKEFMDHLFEPDLEVYCDFANNITFKLDLGVGLNNSQELRCTIGRIFDSTYEVRSSKLQIKKGVISLFLCIQIPIFDLDLDENTVVGVNLGMMVPAYCALNTNDNIKKSLGSVTDYFRVNKRIKEYRRRLQQDLVLSKGGHGRSRKLRALENFSEYESNWRTTYNHNISAKVVEFARANKAKYINLEDLTGYSASLDNEGNEDLKKRFFLKDWPYYQLQQFITYKAAKYGIVVRYVDPAYDSQTCSYCGHYEEGQRSDTNRKEFTCKNPKCKKCEVVLDADFNAARNVSMMTTFIDKEKKKAEEKEKKAKKAEKNRAAAKKAQEALDDSVSASA